MSPRRVAALALALAACPAPPRISHPPPLPLAPPEQHDEPALAGVVHVVKRGETVYRIARAYGIDPADLMETNGISDPRTLVAGTELFVPGAAGTVQVPPAPVSETAPAPQPGSIVAPSPPPGPGTITGAAPPPTSPAATTPPGRAGAGSPLAWPLKGVLYARYGVRGAHRHDGIDIAAPEGTPIGAAAAGTVIYAGEQAGYGSVVILKHDDGLVTLYAHASRILVDEGAHVRRGDPIARVGQTGRTTGPHLHFEVREGTRPRNPLLYLP